VLQLAESRSVLVVVSCPENIDNTFTNYINSLPNMSP
jgi:hypothetical protein